MKCCYLIITSLENGLNDLANFFFILMTVMVRMRFLRKKKLYKLHCINLHNDFEISDGNKQNVVIEIISRICRNYTYNIFLYINGCH